MKLKHIITYIILLCSCITANAQEFVLQGKVTDEQMNPIEFATVSVLKQGKVTMTSLKGEFSMMLHSADSVIVRFSMIGYKTRTRVLHRPKGKQTLLIQMSGDNKELEEVTVTEMKRQTGQTQNLKKEDMKQIPSATGNSVEELVKSQAGVSSHSELSSQYNVRGGSFDENSVYINGIQIYRPFLVRSGQQEGLSIINPYMVENIGFSTGGFEAKYGDRMSSALDITYKKPTHTEATVNVSLLGAGVYLGLGNKKFSWLNSVRYKTNRNLLGSLDTKGEYRPKYLDYQTYFTYSPNKRWTLDFIGNISDNHYTFTPKDRETNFGTMNDAKSFRVYFDGHEKDIFRTYFGSLGITRHITDNTSIGVQASAFYTKEQEKYDIQGQYWLTQTETSENLGVGTFFQHTRNFLDANVESLKIIMQHKTHQHFVDGAITFSREHVKENSVEYEMRDSSGYNMPNIPDEMNLVYSLKAKNTLDANRVEAYLQDVYRFTSSGGHSLFTLSYGIRMSHWNFNHETIVSPRLSLGIIPPFNQNITLRFATGLYYQSPFFKELRDTSIVNGITVASLNNKAKSQRSIHFIAGMDYRFNVSNRPFKFTAEAYYKALSNLVPYSINNVKVIYYGDSKTSGHAAGLDLKLYGEFVPANDSWISFSFMDTKMRLNGKSIPLPTDQRFAMNLFFTDYFPGTDRWKMTLKLAYADGLPFSAPHQELETFSFRAPAYKRADIGMSYRLYNNEHHEHKSIFKNIWLGLDCLNLLGINNVNSYYWITDVTNQQYAVPNYLTGRLLDASILFEF
jgi:hypothetical protein